MKEEDFLMGFRCVGKYWVIACLLICLKYRTYNKIDPNEFK